jgi:uncharacterized membrane protein SpoIIM required for sporulation
VNPWTWLQAAGPFSHRRVLFYGLMSTAVGISCGLLLWKEAASLIGVLLVAMSQAGIVEGLLDRNRDEIWGDGLDPNVANRRLAISLLILFLGVFFAYVITVQLAPESQIEDWFERQLGNFAAGSLYDIDFSNFQHLIGRNVLVLSACFAFALIYRHGGMLLVLAWNASRWGVIFSYLARQAATEPDVNSITYLGKTFLCIGPHLVLEAIAYILVAMSGVFLSKALAKYRYDSDEFLQVGSAVLKIFWMSLAVLVIAAGVEATVAPFMVELLFDLGQG